MKYQLLELAWHLLTYVIGVLIDQRSKVLARMALIQDWDALYQPYVVPVTEELDGAQMEHTF